MIENQESYFEKIERERLEKKASLEEVEREKARFRLDLKAVLRGPESTRFLYRILLSTGVWQSTMKTSSEIYYFSGRASIGFEILDLLQKEAPEKYLEIMKYKTESEKK